MAFRLKEDSLLNAIKHLCHYGDTDVFPHLPELHFLQEMETAIINELKLLDLDTYSPANAIEALVPKSRYGFRIVHQLSMLDTIILLSATIEIGYEIEKCRLTVKDSNVSSYRFKIDGNILFQSPS